MPPPPSAFSRLTYPMELHTAQLPRRARWLPERAQLQVSPSQFLPRKRPAPSRPQRMLLGLTVTATATGRFRLQPTPRSRAFHPPCWLRVCPPVRFRFCRRAITLLPMFPTDRGNGNRGIRFVPVEGADVPTAAIS